MKKKILYLLFLLMTVVALFACQEEEQPCTHEHSDVSVVDPSCDGEGYSFHVCRDCGVSYKTDLVAPLGHELNKTVTPATCEEQGYTTYTCFCGYTYDTEFVEPLGHDLKTRTQEPTCEGEGYAEYYCACGFSYTVDHVAPKGHTLMDTVIPPTCTEQGYTKYDCRDCNYEFISDYTKPTGHHFSEHVVYPTSFSKGYTEFTCACTYSYVGNYVMPSDVYHGAYVDGTEILAYGVNISSWDEQSEKVDYAKLKAAGIDYVILRAGTSKGKDRIFEEHYLAAREAGLDVGCYFYTYATTMEQILAEADLFLSWIEGKQFEYPVYLDVEDPSMEALDSKLLTDMCDAFIARVQSEGWFCGLYVNNKWLVDILETDRVTSYFDVWYARWMLSDEPAWNDEKFGTRMGMWQYTAEGTVDGREAVLDLNVSFKDYPTLIKKYHLNGF